MNDLKLVLRVEFRNNGG